MFTIKRGDLLPPIQGDLRPPGLDITGATVRFHLVNRATGAIKVDAPATIVQPTNPPKVKYDWEPGDTDTVGKYDAEWEVTFADGKPMSFPNDGHMMVIVKPDLA